MKIYSPLAIIAGMCLSLVCACGGGGNDILSALGESCTKTADCVSPLRCVALVCVADADGDDDAADNIETMDGDQDADITEDADLTEPDPDADAAEDDADTAEKPDMADGDEADPEETVEQDAETEIESEPAEETELCPGDAPRNSLQDGVCQGSVQVCTAEGWTDDYSAVDHYEETEAICDGFDNDCDGAVDEDLSRSCGTDVGECVHGAQYCISGSWGPCQDEVTAQPEICDGFDNDCDGAVDENLSRSCGTDVGECVHGTQYCISGSWGPCQDEITAQPEICDGFDNDCDGAVDENLSRSCGTDVGECVHGTQYCISGSWGPCQDEITAQPEICDGFDNDCDGAVDENLSRSCGTDVGECVHGTQYCISGSWGPCQDEITAQPEICDGFDNDCDGAVDEDLSRSCGTDVGECVHGTQYCISGSWGPCQDEVTAQPEICDGFDNDCDGRVDDGCE